MRIKRIKIGIKDVKTTLDDFVKTAESIKQGRKVKKETGVYFSSFEVFRKALTPKRLELLHTIKTKTPSSINQLARLTKRDIKNVAGDVKYLVQVGLVEKTEKTGKKICPSVSYNKIMLEIAV